MRLRAIGAWQWTWAVAVLATLVAAAAVLLGRPAGRSPESNRPGEIHCTATRDACIIKNLHVSNGTLHVYSAQPAGSELPAHVLVAGFGAKSPRIKVVNTDATICGTGELCLNVHHNRKAPHPLAFHENPIALYAVLWDNFFRTLYAALGLWFTLRQLGAFFPERFQHVLLDDRALFDGLQFRNVLNVLGNGPAVHVSDLRDGCYRFAVVGLWQAGAVRETEVEPDPSQDALAADKRLVVHRFRERLWATLTRPPRVDRTVVLERGNVTRQLANLNAVAATCRSALHLAPEIAAFTASIPLSTQAQTMRETMVLLGAHGAGLAHVLLLRPGALLVEIVPYGLPKRIYLNLARLADVKYLALPSAAFPATANIHAPLPVDWRDMSSKDYWRSHSVTAPLATLGALGRLALASTLPRFLLYMPWQRFGNQMVGLVHACAVARLTGRVLVLPLVGLPPNGLNEFSPQNWTWHAYGRYLDSNAWHGDDAPCETIDWPSWRGAFPAARIALVEYADLGSNTTRPKMVLDYYRHILGERAVESSVRLHGTTRYQLSADRIKALHVREHVQTLALGAMFNYYDFGAPLVYPQREFANWAATSAVYRAAAARVRFHPHYSMLVRDWLQFLRLELPGAQWWLALHLRLGDYSAERCSQLPEKLAERCQPDPALVAERVAALYASSPPQRDRPVVLLVSNTDPASLEQVRTFKTALSALNSSLHVVTRTSLCDRYYQKHDAHTVSRWDAIDWLIVDQLLAQATEHFIGNLYSSVSRMIADQRFLLHDRASAFW